jgi:hypothetical protein
LGGQGGLPPAIRQHEFRGDRTTRQPWPSNENCVRERVIDFPELLQSQKVNLNELRRPLPHGDQIFLKLIAKSRCDRTIRGKMRRKEQKQILNQRIDIWFYHSTRANTSEKKRSAFATLAK